MVLEILFLMTISMMLMIFWVMLRSSFPLIFLFFFSSFSPHPFLPQTLLLCFLECGADPVLIESGIISIGASTDTLENLGLRPLDLGDRTFIQLPDDVQVGC